MAWDHNLKKCNKYLLKYEHMTEKVKLYKLKIIILHTVLNIQVPDFPMSFYKDRAPGDIAYYKPHVQ